MRVLITGGAGFVGINLVAECARQGNEVHATWHGKRSHWRREKHLSVANWHQVDLIDQETVALLFQRVKPEVVVHAATYGGYPWQSDVHLIHEVAIRGTLNLIGAAAKAGTRLFVNLGSSSEYGPHGKAMRESSSAKPDRVYGVCKLAQTELCRISSSNDLKTVTLRLFSAYGPWEEPGRLVPNLLLAALREVPFVGSTPNIVRDFVAVEDVCQCALDFDGLLRVSESIINLGTGIETTIGELVGIVEHCSGTALKVKWSASSGNPWDRQNWRADTSVASVELAHPPQTPLVKGIESTYRWMRSYLDGNPAGYVRSSEC